MKRTLLTALIVPVFLSAYAQSQSTKINISIPPQEIKIDPMIYGQMLENVNDSVIYGGVVDKEGNENFRVTELLKELCIPVMRWPAGTAMHEYRWRDGIGSKELRPVVHQYAWKGIENYQFGTDEFLQWSERIKTEPYININMGNDPLYEGTLWEALDWIEYVNGNADSSSLGKLRAFNGRRKPYDVKYWCIGNENYLTGGRHTKETDTAYAAKLRSWTEVIHQKYPALHLMGVGHTAQWNETVLKQNGNYIDLLTQHYYVNSKVRDGKIENPNSSLFAPSKMEVHLKMLGAALNAVNARLGRNNNPIRLSVDEWNNRHSVFNGTEYKFSRQSIRKQFDAAVTAGMLNVFIRQSPVVGMANYIFPVNGHGLIRTVGNDDAYATPLFYLFKQYREWMTGSRLDVHVTGPGIVASAANITISGDCAEADLGNELLTFVDAAGVMNADKTIHVSLVNRSASSKQEVDVQVPPGYKLSKIWTMYSADINAFNTADNRYAIQPSVLVVTGNKKATNKLIIPPCGVAIITFDHL